MAAANSKILEIRYQVPLAWAGSSKKRERQYDPTRFSSKLQFSAAGLEKAFYTGWQDQWEASLDEVRKSANHRPCSLSLQLPDFSGRWKDRLWPRLRHQSSRLMLRIVAMTGEGLSLDKKYKNRQIFRTPYLSLLMHGKVMPSIHRFADRTNAKTLCTYQRVLVLAQLMQHKLCQAQNRSEHYWPVEPFGKCWAKPPLLGGQQRPALHPLQSNLEPTRWCNPCFQNTRQFNF